MSNAVFDAEYYANQYMDDYWANRAEERKENAELRDAAGRDLYFQISVGVGDGR